MKLKEKIGMMTASLVLLLSVGFVEAGVTTAFAATPCEHEYGERVVEATCTAQGYTEYICLLCGDNYKDNFMDANGHDYTEITIPATCTEKGFTTHFCKVCGYQYSDNYFQANGHDYETVVTEPTCTEGGFTEHTCKICGNHYIDELKESTGHSYLEEVVEPNCSEGGYKTFTCEHCGERYIGAETEAKGHTFSVHKVKATCAAYGYTEHICEDCHSRYVTDYVKPVGHDYRIEIVPAAEEQLGYTKHVCKTCGYTYLSDFSTSGDNGYIELPEKPKPPAHTHSYVLETNVKETDKIITLTFYCSCGVEDKNLVTLLFVNGAGEIISVKPTGNEVSYAEYSGTYTVSVVDGYGNVMKEFILNAGVVSPDNPNSPVDPDEPKESEHTHMFILYSELNETEKYVNLNYACECSETETSELRVIFTDESGNVTRLAANKEGKVDFAHLSGRFQVTVENGKGEELQSFGLDISKNITLDELENHDETKDSQVSKDNIDKKGSIPTTLILSFLLISLTVVGAVVFIVIKKIKSKNQKENK